MILETNLKVVSRNSILSLLQVKEFFALFPEIRYELSAFKSYGDKNKQISLLDNIDSDFFTRELDAAIIASEADIAVHSAKDLPYPLPTELELYCLTVANDKTDSLVSRDGLTLESLPQGARVGTSSLKRKEELLSLRPDLTIVSIRGTIEERIAQVDKGLIDAVIVATCALRRLKLENRISHILPFKTHALQGNLALIGKKGNADIKAVFSKHDVRNTYGNVTLVGFGPGNPDLLTIGGDKALSNAEVIFYDDLTNKDFLIRYKADKIYVGKRKGKHSYNQDEINELIYQAALAGKEVVRLKGGDPMIFAHGREEIDFLQSRFVEVKVIPGISAGIALASYTHIPLTHRGVASSVAFITGHSINKTTVPQADTLVYYMAGTNIAGISKTLIESGRKPQTPVALVHNVSLPDQKTVFTTLDELQFSVIKYPTPIIIIIGDVVSFENNAAKDQKTLVTGTTSDRSSNNENIIHTPLITIEKSKDINLSEVLKSSINSSQWIVFSSRYGVRYFFEILKEIQFDIRFLNNIKIASVGKVTSSTLAEYNIYPYIESDTQSAEGIIKYFTEKEITNNKILLPRSDKGLKFLSDQLEQLGNEITDIPIYTNSINQDALKADLDQFQKITFSSPSGVDAFKKIYGELPEGIQLVAKGKTTENKIISELNETF